ncbi:MAG: substrate-binding domain-containing protein [Xenococcaceae cyanobacterium MO_188.B19]|nr:substrate-binding domain-containing protein [Xenococcaceae cyanobacterium MO_188.B19]
MKLKNIIAPIQQTFRKTISLLRFNPLTEQGRRGIATSLYNRGRRKLENLEIPQGETVSPFNQGQVIERTQDYLFEPLPNPYLQYEKCDRNNPLGCDHPLETLKKAPSAKFCSRCGFPAQLPDNKEIRGRRGIYQIVRFLGRQENGRIYTAIQKSNGRSIIVKEYLLPRRSFPEATIRNQKKEIFERVVNFQVAASIPSDFRLIIPQEGIKDSNQNRCYLITSNNLASLPNLKSYLTKHGRMEQEQVLKLLDQVLQSLEFLHSHRWQFTSGEIQQGIVHGNLNLDSLLINQTEVGFLVYLWDLAFWEELFDPKVQQISNKKVRDDLVALGNIGLYLLAEKQITSKTLYPLNARDDLNWRGIPLPVKNFLLRLIGLNSPFNDAATARKELRQLMLNFQELESVPETYLDIIDDGKNRNWLLWVIFSAAILLLGGMLWKLLNPTTKDPEPLKIVCCIEKIKKVSLPSNNLQYGTVASEKLDSIFDIDFDSDNNSTYLEFARRDNNIQIAPLNARSFIEILREKQELNLTQISFNNPQQLINSLEPGELSFGLSHFNSNNYQNKFTRIKDNQQVINNIIAYDGLLVYVALNPCPDCEELAEYLEQKITLNQVKDIYTGKVKYWHEINPNIPNNIKIQAFVPKDDYAREIFKQLVFQNQEVDLDQFTEAIASGKIKKQESNRMIRDIRDAWKQGDISNGTTTAGIGFTFQSIAYKQCNVYPLAVVRNSEEFFPMLIKKADNTGVNLFQDLNCKDNKELYQLNEAVFRNRRYPLAFSLNLLYLNNNKKKHLELGDKINEILKTKEFQCHLSHKKLIPLELSEKDCK